jgi:hypothetical protein
MWFDQTGSKNLLGLAQHYEDQCGANEFDPERALLEGAARTIEPSKPTDNA